MDAIRDASGVSLRRLYRLYPAKEDLAEAVLRRRAQMFQAALVAYTGAVEGPRERILAIFDFLHAWFTEPDFRGCPFINAFGEAHGGGVTRAVADQKHELHQLLEKLVAAAEAPPALSQQLLILANGAMVTAAILDAPEVALQAKAAAGALLGEVSRA